MRKLELSIPDIYHPIAVASARLTVIGKVESNILVFIEFRHPSLPRFDHTSADRSGNWRRAAKVLIIPEQNFSHRTTYTCDKH
jgi:hypothetical protein